MANKNTNLLNPVELLDIYGIPYLNDFERREYFTLNKAELHTMKTFKGPQEAIYFAVCLTFFKIKGTLVNFSYRDITAERQHLMERYFSNDPAPKSLPKNRSTRTRIENKVLSLCGYKRYTKQLDEELTKELVKLAPNYPRQRQLCKALLDLLTEKRISIPGYTTIQDIVSTVWNSENNRLVNSYIRYSSKKQRDIIFKLLNKTDKKHHIISIRSEMKSFDTTEIRQEINKHNDLKPVFEIAKVTLPKLRIPVTTISYYANLINYYNGPRLKDINKESAQLYLLCYSHTRYQKLNDNLLEALKKRTLEYQADANEHAKDYMYKQLESIDELRKRISDMLITIDSYSEHQKMPMLELYKHIAKDEMLIAAKRLIDDKFNKRLLFWQYIDQSKNSITLNLRKIFLTIDLEVTNNNTLAAAVNYIKDSLLNNTFHTNPLPHYIKSWVREHYHEYIFDGDKVLHNRLEFFLYMEITRHIATNKLTLKHSIEYKRVQDDLMPNKKWQKDQTKILKKLGFSRLNTPIQKILKTKQQELNELYQIVNKAIINGENDFVILSTDKSGNKQWKLRPLEANSDPNDSILADFQQRSIVDVIHFVNNRLNFTRVFESILPKSKKGEQDIVLIMAAVLANAIRVGVGKMADISDLNLSSLLSAEAAYIRIETLVAAINIINNAAAKLPIFKQWYINSILHASMDGLKLGVRLQNVLARHSKKYYGRGIGVAAYNEIINGFPIAGRIIGSHQYEGNFAFEMVHHLNTSDINPKNISTDMHGINSLNFGLFDLTDLLLAPRIPKPHHETFWGFGKASDYDGYIVRPEKFIREPLLEKEWNNVQWFVSSLLTGDTNPSTIIRKISAKEYTSKTKLALVHYNNIVKSQFLLSFIHDPELRRAVLIALNRGEEYNKLYRAITVYNRGKLKGKSEIEMEIWHQCTRLISCIILYYNTYILNNLYLNAKDDAEKNFITNISPCAWEHVNLLGYYQFCGKFSDAILDEWIKKWDWRNVADFVEKS